jgi:hypothetical protein
MLNFYESARSFTDIKFVPQDILKNFGSLFKKYRVVMCCIRIKLIIRIRCELLDSVSNLIRQLLNWYSKVVLFLVNHLNKNHK